jgi:rhamnulose-1-phosphate aldolase
MNHESVLNLPDVQEMRCITSALTSLGFAEASAGNLSVRIPELPPRMGEPPARETHEFPFAVKELSGRYLLLTATGSRMREVADDPEGTLTLLRVREDGRWYEIVWGAPLVTSEFKAHLAAHRMLDRERPELRAILHAHPPGLIASCHTRQFELKDYFIGTLFRMLPEAMYLLPERFAILPFMNPGSIELARSLEEAFKTHRVALLEGHGIMAIGKTLSEALDFIEVLEKAAEIYLKILAVGTEPQV